MVGEREGDGREGGRMRWVLTLQRTLSQQQISIQSRGCSRCNFCISSGSSLRERRDPSMYKDVRSLKLLPVMSEEKTGHFYICSRHTRSQIPDLFFSLIPKVCHTRDHASRLWLADI